MDLVDICGATSTGDKKRRVNKKNRNWRKWPHLRKTVVQASAMQSSDKNGPKITEEWEQTTMWPSSKKPPQDGGMTNDCGSALRFACSQCKDNSEYSPKDLCRHFVEKHRGSPPVFPCHMCTFNTHEFSYLQVHLLSHKDTFSSCHMCSDNVQRTWAEFSAHLTLYHCSNGKYSCEMCHEFSTCDFREFLEHIYGHDLKEAGEAELSLDKTDTNQLSDAQTLHCQYCGFEASQKWLITKHVNAAHVCQNGTQRTEKRQVHSITMKASDAIPQIKTRLTRSAVRDTCWLTQDCLSLPGREFLDKYCHLSDPQTTLVETQQFLMESVTGETDDQKWTKALKSVLSNVPQDLNVHSKSENASEVAVLTVKNKITVAQNGAAYPKRLKMTPAADESAASDAHNELNGHPLDCRAQATCLLAESKLEDVGGGSNQPSLCTRAHENRENQEVKTDVETKERGKKLEGPIEPDHLKLVHESEKKISTRRIIRRSKMSYRQRRRKARHRKVDRKSDGNVLKIVLKKNPVKERQWVSQSSVEETTEILPTVSATQGPSEGPFESPKASASVPQSEPENRTAFGHFDKPEDATGNECGAPETEAASIKRANGKREMSQGFSLEVDERISHEEGKGGAGCDLMERKKSPAATTQGVLVSDASRLDCTDLQLERSVAASPAAGSPDLSRPLPPESSACFAQPAPKHQERTLKLVAINPSQLIKRPAADQPVVVLNHPDADIPQVARIMEVVNRYREVQKVLLSRRTLSALAALDGEAPSGPTEGPSSVQERFMLRMKFRRLSKKKYEIVDAEPLSRELALKFSCWFCGRVFTCQEAMLAHRQRHLMEWKGPNCENS